MLPLASFSLALERPMLGLRFSSDWPFWLEAFARIWILITMTIKRINISSQIDIRNVFCIDTDQFQEINFHKEIIVSNEFRSRKLSIADFGKGNKFVHLALGAVDLDDGDRIIWKIED